MNTVCLFGSPRPKGNSATLANRFCNTAEKLGSTIQTFDLNKLNFRGCQACMVCKTKLDKCILKDDLEDVLEVVATADILVLATPVYFGEISGQLKTFVDRCFSFLTPGFHSNSKTSRLTNGKSLVFVIAQGQSHEDLFADIYPRYEFVFDLLGFKDRHLIRGCGLNAADDAAGKEDLLNLAEKVAEQIIGKSRES